MQFPMLYSILKRDQWFELLAQNSTGEKTYIYEVTEENAVQNNPPSPDKEADSDCAISYKRLSARDLAKLDPLASARKLSFSEIVYLSDGYTGFFINSLPAVDQIKDLVNEGEAARVFSSFPFAMANLALMNDRVKVKYFNSDWMGKFRSFFSAISNFFRKYNLYIETGVYWPGDSSSWANQLVNQFDVAKKVLVVASELSKEKVSECSKVPLDHIKKMSSDDVKKLRKLCALKNHPDKSQDNVEKFKEINKLTHDLEELLKLEEKCLKIGEKRQIKAQLKKSPLKLRIPKHGAFQAKPLALTAPPLIPVT